MTNGRGKGKGYALQFLQVEWDHPPTPPIISPGFSLGQTLGEGLEGRSHSTRRKDRGKNGASPD